MNPDVPNFERRFMNAHRRLRWRAGLRAAIRLLPWLQVAWVAFWLADRFDILPFEWPVLPSALAFLGIAAVALAWAWWRAPAERDAALVLDRCLGTRELVTAAQTDSSHPLVVLARGQAAAALTDDAVAKALPWPGWRTWRGAVFGGAAALLAVFVPWPFLGAGAVPAIAPAVTETAQSIEEELVEMLQEAEGLEGAFAEEALERLEELVQEMQNGEITTTEEAFVALNDFAQELAELEKEDRTGRQLANTVEEMAESPLGADLARALSEADSEAIREALERASEALSAADAQAQAEQRLQERLAEQLDVMSQQMEAIAEMMELEGNLEEAEALRELAEALQEGDVERAQELMESPEMAEASRMVGEMAGDQELRENLNNLLQQSRAQLGGQPQQLGNSEGPGDQTTNRQVGRGESGNPMIRDRNSDETADQQGEFESFYDSQLLDADTLEKMRIAGETGGEGELLSQVGRGLGQDGGLQRSLSAGQGAAAGGGERAMDIEDVPRGYRDLVRSYFRRNPPGNGDQ